MISYGFFKHPSVIYSSPSLSFNFLSLSPVKVLSPIFTISPSYHPYLAIPLFSTLPTWPNYSYNFLKRNAFVFEMVSDEP